MAVTNGVAAFLRRLPGSWDLVFTRTSATRRVNVHRQERIPLPKEILEVVEVGGRDPLIRRLLDYGMKEEDVARLTGMGLSRVKGIATGVKSERAASA